MTFPHHALRQESVNSRFGHQAMLATAIARQANSRTVRAMRRAERIEFVPGDEVAQRIYYFAHRNEQKMAVRGAFWKNVEPKSNCESSVYQADLANLKVRDLEVEATGEQLNHAGHGALRKL